jgi:hypothetical protein
MNKADLGDLADIGVKKPMAYMPVSNLKASIPEVERFLKQKGLQTFISNKLVKEGALYAFEPAALQTLLNHHKDILHKEGWPSDAKSFALKASQQWASGDMYLPSVARIIALAFDNPWLRAD